MATDRRSPVVRLVAGAIAVMVAVAVLGALLLWVASGARPMPVSFGRTMLGVFGLVLSPLAFAAVGGVLASQVPRNPIGWIFLAVAVSVGMMLPVNVLVSATHEAARQAPTVVVWAAWFRTAVGSPVMISLLIIAALIFPDGRPVGRRWRGAIVATALGGVLLIVATAVDPRGLWSYPSLPNPAALPFAMEPFVSAMRLVAMAILVPCVGLAVAAVWTRYRGGTEPVRAQLRWIVLAVVISGLAALPYLAARFIFEVDEASGELTAAVAQVGSIALPIAAAVAISRYRLFDIDILLGRTLVLVPLTAILGGLYTAGIALFQRLFVAVTGETSDVAIVLAILLVATAFTPLRKALESFAERRFPADSVAPHAASSPGRLAGPAPTFTPAGLLDAGHEVPNVHVLTVDPPGSVTCPLGGRRTIYECLRCEYFRATAAGPTPAVICEAPTTF